jgi:hypothetical protein
MRFLPNSGISRVTGRVPAGRQGAHAPDFRGAGSMAFRTALFVLAFLICLGAPRPAEAASKGAETEELEPETPGPKPAAPEVEAPPDIEASASEPSAAPAIPKTANDSGAPFPASPKADSPKPAAPGQEGNAAAPVTAPPSLAEEPGPDDVTIEVDPGQSRNKDKSLPLAMVLSATLPGSGEWYLHEKGNAKAFLLTEAGFWASLYVAFLARDSYLSSARNYASEYAGIDASAKSSGFLETMATYRSYQEKQHRQDSYELSQVLSGKRDRDFDIAPVEANYWDFGSSVNPENTSKWRTFQQSLRYYRASKVAISFAIGALALNRLASLANTLRVYKRTSAKGLSLRVVPEFGPDYAGTRVSLQF